MSNKKLILNSTIPTHEIEYFNIIYAVNTFVEHLLQLIPT